MIYPGGCADGSGNWLPLYDPAMPGGFEAVCPSDPRYASLEAELSGAPPEERGATAGQIVIALGVVGVASALFWLTLRPPGRLGS